MTKEFRELLEVVAKQHNTTVEEVYKEMQIAIDDGFDNHDPQVQKMWKHIPLKGDRPTPEDIISQLASRVNSENNKR